MSEESRIARAPTGALLRRRNGAVVLLLSAVALAGCAAHSGRHHDRPSPDPTDDAEVRSAVPPEAPGDGSEPAAADVATDAATPPGSEPEPEIDAPAGTDEDAAAQRSAQTPEANDARNELPPQPGTPVGAVPPPEAGELPKAQNEGTTSTASGAHVGQETAPAKRAPDALTPAATEVPDTTTEIGTVAEMGKSGPCGRPQDPNAPAMVSSAQLLLEETTCGAALWLDGLFGDDRNLDSARRTHGQLETSVAYSQFKGTETATRLRVRIDLPNLEKRLSAFFGLDDEEDFIRDRSEGFAIRSEFPRIKGDKQWLAGLGYALPKSKSFQSNIRLGVAGVAHPRIFLQAPARYIVYSDDNDLVYLRGTPFWRSTDGLGITAGIDYNRVLGDTFLLRLLEVGTNSQRNEGYDWLGAAILYQNLRRQRAIAYELFIRGQTDEPEPLYEYGARIIYRHPLVRDHLFAEFLTGYSWPRDDPDKARDGSYSVGLSLQMPFGRQQD